MDKYRKVTGIRDHAPKGKHTKKNASTSGERYFRSAGDALPTQRGRSMDGF